MSKPVVGRNVSLSLNIVGTVIDLVLNVPGGRGETQIPKHSYRAGAALIEKRPPPAAPPPDGSSYTAQAHIWQTSSAATGIFCMSLTSHYATLDGGVYKRPPSVRVGGCGPKRATFSSVGRVT